MNVKLFFILAVASSLGTSGVFAQSELVVGIDSDSFQQGETVVITGNTGENNSVSIQVKDPTGSSILIRSVTADSSGNFDLQFKISQNAILGKYKIITNTVIGELPVIQTLTFDVVERQAETKSAEDKKGGYTVLQTESGTSFMAGFNQFYYSFSSAIADYERENPTFKEAVKLTLTPLLASLTLLQYADIDSESEMLGYGIGIILLNIGMYFVAPAILIMKVRKRI